ncbi:alanine racemase [Candidatus Lariskella endosymbiont of Hedychridium roseum]|uniref:alanine racemase n=1 Tax=Candidatus Lariskella endosymbiont of Hedychridium roseum TaxID=3077949 RepID=UPI0030CA7BB9
MLSFPKITVQIDLRKVARNFEILERIVCSVERKKNGADVAAVVKADAYGLGAIKIAEKLTSVGCKSFFVATLDEAISLRKGLVDCNPNIYILHGIDNKEEAIACESHCLIPVLNNMYQVSVWDDCAKVLDKGLNAILHIDTGLNRLGVNHSELLEFLENKPSGIKLEYVMSHLACAEENDNPRNREQLELFVSYQEYFKDTKFSFANSSGVFLGAEYHFDLVRSGCALFGINPISGGDNPMLGVISATARVIQKKVLERSGYIGYKNSHRAEAGTKCFVVSCGYADGYSRGLSNKGFCYAGGSYLPVVGIISMDLVVFDASKLSEEMFNSVKHVELLGDNIKIDEVAKHAGTISYEIIATKFGKRCNRIYID